MSESSLKDFCNSNGLTLMDGLIQNDNPISKDEAISYNNKYILRWRNRICNITNKPFDITLRGFGYNGEYNGKN
tara:strand:- start:511 stop:732 length:222 start_codon:yes stop_codon:yes gene_type:complete